MDVMFIQMLLLVSVLNGLVTEAIKKILDELKIVFRPTFISMISSVVLSVGIFTGNQIIQHIPWTLESVVYLVALMFMSWLGSGVGYDRIMDIFK